MKENIEDQAEDPCSLLSYIFDCYKDLFKYKSFPNEAKQKEIQEHVERLKKIIDYKDAKITPLFTDPPNPLAVKSAIVLECKTNGQ